jgi:dTDP-glucose pyrophosphorylase
MTSPVLNIVVPMAGHGSRFASAGYTEPKPLIRMGGKTMIEVVVNNLRPSTPHRFIFVCQQAHVDRYALDAHLQHIAPGCTVWPIAGVTQGAACTVLLTKALIDNAQPLMIANCDQYVSTPIDDYLAKMQREPLAGLIMTMTANDPKWSFIRLDSADRIVEVVEKKVVSDEATVGIYNFAHGHDFVAAAEAMIAQDLRVNGEFYVAPTYNTLIAQGARLGYVNIGRDRAGMYGLGVPDDLQYFMAEHFERLVGPATATATDCATSSA